MTIYYLPLEPIDKRYTKQWYDWFREVFEMEGVNYKYIDGEKVEQNVGSKFFLDMKNTFVWKFEQLKRLFREDIEDGDVIFVPDGEYPGLEALMYFKKFYNVDFGIATIWHAATYDHWDLTYQVGLERIGAKLEEVWFDISDVVFVATNYHKKIICERRMVSKNKIKVTGLPVDVEGLQKYKSEERDIDIVFTGRLSYEKGIDVVEKIRKWANEKGYKMILTQEHNFSKEEYYRILGRSKVIVAPSRQETFGYGVVEAMAMDVVPVVPNGLSFTDYVPEIWRYNNEEEMFERIEKGIENAGELNFKKYVEKYQYQKVINRMLDLIDDIWFEV